MKCLRPRSIFVSPLASDYAEPTHRRAPDVRPFEALCGIIPVTALCDLCRYRHNGHATGHGSRLDRQFGKRFGDDAYAAEELLAGLAQSILCAEYGL
ncbi:MAG: hypothetical protein KA778_13795, partial [Burkholderiaceae bacterium]|nr:hypothetical protein [Burkholderiaceae bacterium]